MSSELPLTFQLGPGIPAIGLGTFQPDAAHPSVVKKAVLDALNAGYRHIDTAYMYGDGTVERAVGEALREWAGPREKVFVVSKLANAHHAPEDVAPALELSLQNLGLDYIDLYLMHYPIAYVREGKGAADEWKAMRNPDGKPKLDMELSLDYASTWSRMEDLLSTGKVRYIGVSNFSVLKLRRLLQGARHKPVVNQVELHPYLPQSALLHFCRQNGIHVTAHSPLGGRPIATVALRKDMPGPIHDCIINAIAGKHGRSAADILLQWAIQRGTSVVPKSYSPSNILANIRVLNYPKLSSEDMAAIENLRPGKSAIRFMDPSKYYGFDLFNEEQEEPKIGEPIGAL